MSLRIRGQEQTLQVIIEGQDQAGTFINVRNWKATPRIDNVETDFVGQDESDLDQQYHGVDFEFTVQEEDGKARAFLADLIARQANRERPAKVTLIAHNEYRDTSEKNDNLHIYKALMKPDSFGSSGRKDYSEIPFSGKGKLVDVVEES
jgi:hypothetical protein